MKREKKTLTSTGRTHKNGPELLSRSLPGRHDGLCLRLERVNFLVELGYEMLEVLELI